NSFVTWWRRTHFENSMIDALLRREHTSYREVGHRSVAFVLERAGIPYTLDRCTTSLLISSGCDRFQTCPKRSLDYERVIRWWFSPMVIRTCWKRRSATTVISVAVANAFKPHVATYTKAAEIVGVRMDEVLFIANHAFDCIGAKSAGMRTAFID